MAKKQFKTESKRILDLMVNSIYTNKEIFLREIISNASDAIDKLYFKSLTDQSVGMTRDEFKINVAVNEDERTITVSDNGIGMTKDELDENLGTIAKSGSFKFVNENQLADDIDIIGQFGVGFYSVFMVADKVTVVSKAFGEEQAYKWVSTGGDGYTITEDMRNSCGTDIIIHLKDDTDEESYSEFLEQYRLTSIIKKYSDYVRYPICMDVKESHLKEGTEDEYEDVIENKVINSQVPIWKKDKKDLKDEDYNNFFKDKYYDFADPLCHIHQKAEGTTTYQALLYIPSHADYNYYSKDFERGLQLYSSGVLIMDKCTDLLPEHFGFVKGLVDSEDLNLNISREMLQHDRQLAIIRKALEKKIKNELMTMQEKEREKYEKFFNVFGLTLKFGIYQTFGANKEELQDLLLFARSSDGKMVTLKEYVENMKEDQKYIYFAAGETAEQLSSLPQAELLKDRGYDMLLLTDEVDEFLMQALREYDKKEFKSVSAEDLGLESDDEKKELEKEQEDNKELLTFMKDSLDGKISDVVISSRLKTHPVCLTAKGNVSLEMEKVLSNMPGSEKPKAERILEINASHPVFETLKANFADNKDKVKNYAYLLYNQALLIEGFSVEDPVKYSLAVCELMK